MVGIGVFLYLRWDRKVTGKVEIGVLADIAYCGI